MNQTLTFEEYVKNELKDEDIKNKEIEYDDYSITVEVDYTIQE
jgi:hypothetical protein